MSDVYVVEQRDTGRTLVGKVLRQRWADDAQLRGRLRFEAQSVGRLKHDNIVTIVDQGDTWDCRPYLVMEYLEGRTLAEEVAHSGRLPVLEAVAFACELLSALAAAHELGVVHRDIKPDNLFICSRPRGGRYLKVLDFGVARLLPDAPPSAPRPLQAPTDDGIIVGTPRYLSPEAAAGKRVDARADLYAAALVVRFMLSGRVPYDHLETQTDVFRAHASETLPPLATLIDTPLPPELEAALDCALRKDKERRFRSAREFLTALLPIAEGLVRPAGCSQTTNLEPARGDQHSVGGAQDWLGSAPAVSDLSDAPDEPRGLERASSAAEERLPVSLFVLCLVVTAIASTALTVSLRGLP